MNEATPISAIELSLAGGGISTRICERFIGVHLPDRRGCLRLALILALATWLPLAILSALGGAALPGTVRHPFFHDITPHVRLLFALPLLILADIVIGPFSAQIGNHFIESKIVPDKCLAQFHEIAESAIRVRNSRLAELVVLLIAYATAVFNVQRELGTGASSWLLASGHGGLGLTPAGWWYVLLSVPIYQFFLFRWIMRLCNWAVFLFRTARLDLDINPTHPDRAAGLGFIGEALTPLSIIMLAASSVLCSSIGTQVIYRGAQLQEFALAFVLFVVIATVAFLAPFVVFMPKLAMTRRNGLMKYGALATRYTQLFERKWVAGERPAPEELLGTSDIQSLADLAGSFDRVDNMKLFPIGLRDLRGLLIAALLPAIPLSLTQVSPGAVMQILAKVLL